MYHLQSDDGAGLVPAPSICAICGDPYVTYQGRAEFKNRGRLTRACDACRRVDYERAYAKQKVRVQAKSKKGKDAQSECARCGDTFVYMFKQRTRTVCDPCRRYDQEWLKFRLNHRQVEEIRSAGRCDICGATSPGGRWDDAFHIDHDHASGRVRGCLCSDCNRVLGMMNDDPARLRAAADYLERSS